MSRQRLPKPPVANEGKRTKTITPRSRHLLKKYGITEDDYNLLLERQNWSCGVCGRHQRLFKQRLAVDHDHKTGEVRGLLCTYCNRRIISRHRRELGASLLQAAFEYLTRDYSGWIVPPKIKKRKHVRRRSRLAQNVKRKTTLQRTYS